MTQPQVHINVLCYGNNRVSSSRLSKFYDNLPKERLEDLPFNISFHYPADLNLFERFEDPVYTPEVADLIGQEDQVGRNVDVFLILISLEHVMSQNMYELLTGIPTQLRMNEGLFWRKAIVAFSMKEDADPVEFIQLSIEGNVGVKQMVEKVRERYTYLVDSEPNAFLDNLVIHIQSLRRRRNETIQSIGSVLSYVWRQSMSLARCLCRHISLRRFYMGLLMLRLSFRSFDNVRTP